MSKYKPHAIFNPYRYKVFEYGEDLGDYFGTVVSHNGLIVPLNDVAPKDPSIKIAFATSCIGCAIRRGPELLAVWCAIHYQMCYPWLTISKTARMVRVWLAKAHNQHYSTSHVRNMIKKYPTGKRTAGRPPKS